MVADWSQRTEFAERALTIAEMFGLVVGTAPLQGPAPYRVEMAVPDGPSTGGGARSVQHLRLVPVGKGTAIVIGSCDQIEMAAVLRSWELVAEQYAARFKGAKLPVDAVEYGKLLERMEAFFRERTMRVDKLDIDRAPSSIRPAPEAVNAAPLPGLHWVVALVLLGAAIGSGLTLLLLR